MAQVTQAAERAGAYEAAMQEHARSAANCAMKSATAPDFDATTQILTKASKILEQAAATLVEAMGFG